MAAVHHATCHRRASHLRRGKTDVGVWQQWRQGHVDGASQKLPISIINEASIGLRFRDRLLEAL
jgi:hypothetical protein